MRSEANELFFIVIGLRLKKCVQNCVSSSKLGPWNCTLLKELTNSHHKVKEQVATFSLINSVLQAFLYFFFSLGIELGLMVSLNLQWLM